MNLLSHSLSVLSHKLSFRCLFLYTNDWRFISGWRYFRRRALHTTYHVNVAIFISRVLALIIWNPEVEVYWQFMDPLVFEIANIFSGNLVTLFGYGFIGLFDHLTDLYCIHYVHYHYNHLYDDFLDIYSDGLTIAPRTALRSNPYLTIGQKARFLSLLKRCEFIFLNISTFLLLNYLISTLIYGREIWNRTREIWIFGIIQLDIMGLLVGTLLPVYECVFALLVGLISIVSTIWSLSHHSKRLERMVLLTGSSDKLPRVLFWLELRNTHWMHINLKHKTVHSTGGIVRVLVTYGLIINSVANVTFIVGLYLHSMPMTIQLVMVFIIVGQISILATGIFCVIAVTNHFYSMAKPLIKAATFMLRWNIDLRDVDNFVGVHDSYRALGKILKFNTFFEMIVTKQRFKFKVGSIGAITKHSILTFFLVYSTWVINVLPFSKRFASRH